MSVLKKHLESLPLEEKNQLLYALENGLNQWITLENGRFIGVNVKGLPQLLIIEEMGSWSYGIIRN